MRRLSLLVVSISGLLVVGGVFWAGRESSSGFDSLWEHWWCPLPLVAIFIGLVLALGVLVLVRRSRPAGDNGELPAG